MKMYKLDRSGFQEINPDPDLFETFNALVNIDSRLFNYQITNIQTKIAFPMEITKPHYLNFYYFMY